MMQKTSKINPFHGYTKLANFMGNHPGTANFRRFAELNAKILLYAQAELVRLEIELRDQENAEDQFNDCDRHQSAIDLMKDQDSNSHRAKISEIQQKLHLYNELLLQQEKLYKLPRPNDYDLWFLRTWLVDEAGGNGFLTEIECDIWRKNLPARRERCEHDKRKLEEATADLVALSSRGYDGDLFTRWVADCLAPVCTKLSRHSKKSRDLEDPESQVSQNSKAEVDLQVYMGTRVKQFTQVFSIVFASLLPTVSIFALNALKTTYSRLGFVMGFSAAFSFCLFIFTSARRVEIFTAAVALASVQVVFIGTSS